MLQRLNSPSLSALLSAVKKALTTLLRCYRTHCGVTTLLRNSCKPAPLLGSGPPIVIVNGAVTTVVS